MRASYKRLVFHPVSLGIIISIAAIALQQSHLIVESLVKSYGEGRTVSKSPLQYQIDVSNIPVGQYFLTVGRPHGRCKILADHVPMKKNYSDLFAVREDLLLGTGFLQNGKTSLIDIICHRYKNPVLTLNHKPILAKYNQGVLLHQIRGFTYLFIGPFAALILLASTIIGIIGNFFSSQPKDERMILYRYGQFALVGVAYALSLAHFPRLVFDENTSYILHILLRHLYSVSFLFIALGKSKTRSFLTFLHAASSLVTIYYSSIDAISALKAYKFQYTLFWLSGIYAITHLLPRRNISRSNFILTCIAASWALSQTVDWANLWFRFGAYNSPSLLAMISFLLITSMMDAAFKRQKIMSANSRIVAGLKSESNVVDFLKNISYEMGASADYRRVSAYIDRFSLGLHNTPKDKFSRVYEHGYEKPTEKDQVISFRENRGRFMQEALETQEIKLRKGADKEWFIVMPVGQHVCINLSISESRHDYVAFEGLELLKLIRPSLNELESRIIDLTTKSKLAMHRIRSVKGLGSWELEIGSIFIDVADYSKAAQEYGSAYAKFIGEEYFAALCRRLHSIAIPEKTIGDEIYFVVIEGVIDKSITVEEAVRETIKIVAQFEDYEGAEMAINSGFTAPRLRTGVSIGQAELISGEDEVKTAGHSVIMAKRLQQAARKGEILLEEATAHRLADDTLDIGQPRRFLQKENLITATPLRFSFKGKKSA